MRRVVLMDIGSKLKSLKRTDKIVISTIAAIVVVAVAVICFVVFRNSMLANTMRLLRIEGTVNLEDSKGSSKPVIDNLRFRSGDALNTGADGLASIGLDDSKIVTLQNDSRAEFKKKRKQLELKLTKGAVFFNVTEKLKEDEKFEIKTSTMTAGIRVSSTMIRKTATVNPLWLLTARSTYPQLIPKTMSRDRLKSPADRKSKSTFTKTTKSMTASSSYSQK